MRITALFLALLLLIAMLGGCSAKPTAQVVATTLPVYQFTQLLCEGTGITVSQLVTQSVSCLHDYTLNVSQVRAAEAAEVVVISGMGLEDFMEDILPEGNVIDSSIGIEAHHAEHHHEGHHHEQDAHIWLSPDNAMVMAANICDGLCLRFPEHQDTFRKNLIRLSAQLEELRSYAESTLSVLSCRKMVTFHDGFTYLAESFDLTILKAIEEESGSEASAQELIELVQLVQEHDLPAIFTEVNGSASAAEIIAAETGTAIFSLDMAITGDDYFKAMYHNIDTIKEALG